MLNIANVVKVSTIRLTCKNVPYSYFVRNLTSIIPTKIEPEAIKTLLNIKTIALSFKDLVFATEFRIPRSQIVLKKFHLVLHTVFLLSHL